MESILARALEYTLKYWFKSFTRDQFKLQGRTVQLSNLDISGDALHASLGLPPAITVSMAKSGRLEIVLPYLSNVQLMPIVVQIDKLDVVLEENDDFDSRRSTSSAQAPSSASKSSGYGFAEKIADGMTLQIETVNLLLETHGGGRHLRGGTWASPMASITIRNLVLYTTNENWQVVNLKAAREFSSGKNFIYVFRKLEWEYLSIDLLPHPDMLSGSSEGASNRKDDDGAKRVFFGGERFIDGISGEAYITIQRTDLNWPLGLEVQVHISEAICPALSEPGLRALLRFFMGLYVCINREDVNPNAQEQAEAAGRTLVSFMVDHIFLGVKDAGFQLEFLMQSLFFSRASVSDGEVAKFLTQFMVGGLILRDTFSRPPCPLVQPSMLNAAEEIAQIPDFGKNFCPPIYPLDDQQCRQKKPCSLLSIHSVLFMPSLFPPSFSSQTMIDCKPLTIHLQEESCLRILSLLADGIVVNPDDITLDMSISSLHFNVKELNITVPLEARKPNHSAYHDNPKYSLFKGARLHIENLYLSESPSMRLGLLNLDMDAACFCLWEGQPIDSSQRRWAADASFICLSLETCNDPIGDYTLQLNSSELWRCVEMTGVCLQVAMVTSDGSPIRNIPPPGGIVRAGVACEQFMSNTSIEQLFYVLDLYSYIDNVSGKMAMAGESKWSKIIKKESSDYKSISQKGPADTAISLACKKMELKFLEASSMDTQGTPLIQFIGDDLLLQRTHRTLGAAMAISSTLRWERVQVACAANDVVPSGSEMRAVFWVQNRKDVRSRNNTVLIPFLNLSIVHVIPYDEQDRKYLSLRVSGCIAGVRLAVGMNYNEALLHRIGILGPDGRPGVGLSKGLERLSAGPLSKLFEESPPPVNEVRESQNESIGGDKHSSYLNVDALEDVNISVELKDWLFVLESMEVMSEKSIFNDLENSYREERSWHTCFESIMVQATGSKNDTLISAHKYPVEVVRVRVDSWKTVKPLQKDNKFIKIEPHDGIDLDFDIVTSQENDVSGTISWALEHLKISSKQPIEIDVCKDEIQHVTQLCTLEINSLGRMASGILQLLKHDGSVGQAAANQLSHPGSEGIEERVSPRNQSTDTKTPSFDHGQPSVSPPDNQCSSFASTLSSLEAELSDSQSNCATLFAELSTTDSSNPHFHSVQQLAQKLESMQSLLTRLRNQV